MTKADIRAEQFKVELNDVRKKRTNHSETRVKTLLAIPLYRDLREDQHDGIDDEVGVGRDPMDIDDTNPPSSQSINRKWLPITLEKLFDGEVQRPIDDFVTRRPRRHGFNEEVLRMELMAAEYSDEPLDDAPQNQDLKLYEVSLTAPQNQDLKLYKAQDENAAIDFILLAWHIENLLEVSNARDYSWIFYGFTGVILSILWPTPPQPLLYVDREI
ncbi:hypothetical protein K435DRAFT_853072 [Dendrothele bispora CBS 962.96]|uniref:Uncharacterized protein n=1 Tax=Dendrothele bispora (strain CBS 962.96) TaxID=1314807 RepID=A0A4S8MHE8_DENBC|nr:hypothetical protein K435DRAFT_853072 [Dendrothele bispora CBS 962.96]